MTSPEKHHYMLACYGSVTRGGGGAALRFINSCYFLRLATMLPSGFI